MPKEARVEPRHRMRLTPQRPMGHRWRIGPRVPGFLARHRQRECPGVARFLGGLTIWIITADEAILIVVEDRRHKSDPEGRQTKGGDRQPSPVGTRSVPRGLVQSFTVPLPTKTWASDGAFCY